MSSNGVKHDSEKPMMALLSPFALEEIAKVMTFGAKKYSADNWRGGFKYTRVLSAVMRHLMAYQRGEAKDAETGLSHLAHASCGLMMLLEFEQTGAGENDIYWQQKQQEPVESFDKHTGTKTIFYEAPSNTYTITVPPGCTLVVDDDGSHGVNYEDDKE